MDIHHVLNSSHFKEFVDGYNKRTGLSIALLSREHYILSKERKRIVNSFKELVEEEMLNFRNYTNVPYEIIQLIEKKINEKYSDI